MFAPPMPTTGNRRQSSAAVPNTYAHYPYDLPQQHPYSDPVQHPPPNIQRRSSQAPIHRNDEGEDLVEVASQTQDHMNVVTKHSKVKIEVVLDSPIFEAGGSISGRIELTCTTSQRLRLGELAVELEAVEQLTSRDHVAAQTFLYNRIMFQGENLPPSNAVVPSAPINGYWTARKGRTAFAFSFKIPNSAPSCVNFAGNASLRYGLKATVQTWYNDEKMIVTARRQAFVLEKWKDELDHRYLQPVEAVSDTQLFMGGNGTVWLEAGVTEQLFWAGGQIIIRCGIKNNTKRHLSGIKVALARRLIFPVGSPEGLHDTSATASLEPRITELTHEQSFKGREYEFNANAETVCNVAVDIPKDMRTIRKTRLFEVRVFAIVSLMLGSLAKDLTIELPIYVAHTASAQRPARADLCDLRQSPPQRQTPNRPHSSADHAHSRPHLSVELQHTPQHPSSRAYEGTDRRMLEVEQLAAARGWSPAPIFESLQQVGLPTRSASAAPGMVQIPAQPFSPHYNISAGGWNMAPFAAHPHTDYHIQRAASAAPDVLQHAIVRPISAGSSVSQTHMQHVPPTHAPSWVPPQQGGHIQPPQQDWHVQQQQQPQPQQGRRASLPMPGPHGGNAAMPQTEELYVPLVAGPSTHPEQSDSAAFFPPAPIVAGLATIEEDSESQAGTIKTLRNMPTLSKSGTKGVKSNSVSRNNIEQFEAMAEAEEDEEEIKRQMIAMGMQPDEASFSIRSKVSPIHANATATVSPLAHSQAQQTEQADVSKHVASSTRRTAQSQSTNASASRPRAIDIFNPSNGSVDSLELSVDSTDEWKAHHDELSKEKVKAISPPHHVSDNRMSSVTPLRRASSSQGSGLEALESKLHRASTPKTSDPQIMVLDNVAKRESFSSPFVTPSPRDDSTRSRKDSALRAAALAREAAEAKAFEEQARVVEDRRRRQQEEEIVRIEAAKAQEAAAQAQEARDRERKEEEHRALEARKQAELERVQKEERMERERAAEQANIERQRAERIRAEQLAQVEQEARIRAQEIEQERAILAQLEAQRQRREEAAAIAAAEAAYLELQQQEQQRHRKEQAEEEQRRSEFSSLRFAPIDSHGGLSSQADESVYTSKVDAMSLSKTPASLTQSSWSTFSQVPRNESVHGSVMPKSKTMADMATRSTSRETEDSPPLSAELRALIDGAGVPPARKAGNALINHPITRKISVSDRPEQAPDDSILSRKDRHTPSWPRPGLSSPADHTASSLVSQRVPSSISAASSNSPSAKRSQELFSPADKVKVIPSRMQKTLEVPDTSKSGLLTVEGEKQYDTRSARGGRGGRVATVAQLWSKIAGDDENVDQVPDILSKSNTQATPAHKPQARRSSAPALDFSKKKLMPALTSGVTADRSADPSLLKSTNAAHFLNTSSTAKPIFATASTTKPTEMGTRRPLPKPVTQPGSTPSPQLVRPTAVRANSSQQQLQTSSAHDSRSVRNMMSKVAVDQSVLQALQGDYSLDTDLSTLRLADGTEVKMSGRGTTKAIGDGKLKSLRAVWGS